ncbi:MAG: hypothetical protein IKQ44_10310 [Lachnospiraceae bacterium]|nr:hypothetical protein [Lachnospiraceae bacterium]
MDTYEEYLDHKAGHILAIEDAQSIYKRMTDAIAKCEHEAKKELWDDFVQRCFKYTLVRCKWEFMDYQERIDADPGRTRMHDTVIDSIEILARLAKKEGMDTTWRDDLGNERKRLGDFACFVTYITGISNR